MSEQEQEAYWDGFHAGALHFYGAGHSSMSPPEVKQAYIQAEIDRRKTKHEPTQTASLPTPS